MTERSGQTIGILSFFIVSCVVVMLFFLKIPIQLSFLFIFSIVVFTVSFINTDFALVILIFSMLLSPELKTGGGIPGREVVIRVDDIFLFVIFLGWWAKMAVNKELGVLKSTVLNKPILVYIMICVVSTFFGIMQGYINIKHAFFYLLKYFEYFLLFFMVVNNLRSVSQAKTFIFFMLLTCFFVCAYAWMQIGTGERLSAPFEGAGGEPNTFAGYLLLMIALILGLILYAGSRKTRLLLFALLGFAAIPFILTLSRGGWLAFLPMYLTVVFLNKKYRLLLVTVFIALVILSPYIFPGKVYHRVQETFAPEKTYKIMGKTINLAESAAARVDAWKVAFTRLGKKPVFGFGVPTGAVVDNQFTRVLGETGILGFLAFIWIIVTVFKAGWRAYTSSLDTFSRGVVLGFIAGLVGVLFQSLTSANFIIIRIMEPFWFLAGIVVKLPELMAQNE